MSLRYRELFRLRIRHTYFADTVCRGVSLVPTPECSRMLERYGCLFRPRAGGGTVYYESSATGPNLVSGFNERSPLRFTITTTGPEIALCTDMGTAPATPPPSSVFYFSNLEEHPDTAGEGRIGLLHPPDRPFEIGELPVTGSAFTYPLRARGQASTFQIIDVFGKEVRRVVTTGPETQSIFFELGDLEDGRYLLTQNGRPEHDFFLSMRPAVKVWGIVEIFPGGPAMPGLPEKCRVLDKDGRPREDTEFTISLEPRRSIWRYYIVSQAPADRVYDDCRITGALPKGRTNGAAPILFQSPLRQKLNGKDAWIFESAAPIPVYEYPAERHEFTLSGSSRGSGFGAITLPYAQSDKTRLETGPDGKPRACSEIYVYL